MQFFFFIVHFTFIFRAEVKATSTQLFFLFWEAGNHCIASWDAAANQVSSVCILEMFTRAAYKPDNRCAVQTSHRFF